MRPAHSKSMVVKPYRTQFEESDPIPLSKTKQEIEDIRKSIDTIRDIQSIAENISDPWDEGVSTKILREVSSNDEF